MSATVPKNSFRNVAVLAISSTDAEWLEYDANGLARYGCASIAGEGVGEIVQAAVEARSAAGGSLRRCRLALGEGRLSHRVLALPPLSKSELRNVLQRKAANFSDLEGKSALFSSMDVGPAQAGARNWLLVTMKRELITALLIGLRGQRFQIRRVVSTALAGLHQSPGLEEDQGKATIVVTVGQAAVEVSLIADDRLASSDTLEGNLEESPHLVTGLMQLVRTAAAFWRKSQRGAEVGVVRVIGMPTERGVFLAQAIAGALPGTQVVCDPSAEDEAPEAGRIAVLSACLGDGPLALDVQVSLPMRRSMAAFGLVACAISLLLGVGVVQRVVEEPRTRLLYEIAELKGRAADLPHLERHERAVRESMTLISRRLGRAQEIGRDAPDYDAAMSSVLSVLRDQATLLSIVLAPGAADGHDLRFSAVTNSTSPHSLSSVRRIERALKALPELSDVHVDLPTSIEESDGDHGLSILVRAVLKAPR